jgi:hypothetical protein
MNASSWLSDPFAVHVSATGSAARRLEDEARRAGASVVRLDLSGVRDRAGLGERLAQTFLFPHETRGLDAAIDLISDLEWFGGSDGYLVIVDGMNHASVDVIADFAGILPPIVDRWRSQRRAFVIVLVGDDHGNQAASALIRANARLVEAGKVPWAQPGTGAVTIVDHAGAGS